MEETLKVVVLDQGLCEEMTDLKELWRTAICELEKKRWTTIQIHPESFHSSKENRSILHRSISDFLIWLLPLLAQVRDTLHTFVISRVEGMVWSSWKTLATDFLASGCPNLRYLEVSNCRANSEAVSVLLEAMPYLPSLEYLDIRGNDAGPSSAAVLSKQLCRSKTSQKLHCIRVGQNLFGQRGDAYLSSGLATHQRITSIDSTLQTNGVLLQKVSNAVKKNRKAFDEACTKVLKHSNRLCDVIIREILECLGNHVDIAGLSS